MSLLMESTGLRGTIQPQVAEVWAQGTQEGLSQEKGPAGTQQQPRSQQEPLGAAAWGAEWGLGAGPGEDTASFCCQKALGKAAVASNSKFCST